MKYIFISIIYLVLGLSSASATFQTPDILIYNGKQYYLRMEILKDYFRKHPEIQFPKEEISVRSSDLWRGYRATFEIKDEQLFLKDIQIQAYNKNIDDIEWKSVLKEMFPNQNVVKLEWITGLLIVSEERIFDPKDKEYSYTLFAIDKGDVKHHRELPFHEYRIFTSLRAEKFKEWKTVNYSDEYINTIKVPIPENMESDFEYFIYISFFNFLQ